MAVKTKHENSLAVHYPNIASEWHPTKNGYFKPCHVKPRSGKRVWWLCPECGNEWPQYIKTRSNHDDHFNNVWLVPYILL